MRSLLPRRRTVSFSTRRSANTNAEPQEFIDLRLDAREERKALAVKLIYQDYLYEEIQTILDISLGSITDLK
jgi:putative transposase